MSAAGWRFTVNIPQWIHGKDDDGQDVVFYRVNVLLQGPGSPPPGSRPPFFVLRRYNQFRHMYDQLRIALPDVMKERSLAPPPKHALHIKGSKEMCDRRRADLEAWMWRLLSNPAVSRSTALRQFLEWDRALAKTQAATRAATTGGGAYPHSEYGGGGGSVSLGGSMPVRAMGGSDLGDGADSDGDAPYGAGGDARSEISTFSAATTSAAMGLGGRLGGGAAPGPPQPPYARATYPGGMALLAEDPVPGGGAAQRLGIKLESRADLRRLVSTLQARLIQGAADLGAAVHEVATLQEANRLLTQRVTELGGSGGVQAASAQQVAALEAQVEELRTQLAEAQDQAATVPALAAGDVVDTVATVRAAAHAAEAACARAEVEAEALRQELSASEDIRVALARQLASAEEAVTGRVQLLSGQVSELQAQLHQAQQENATLLGRLAEWGVPPAAASAAGPLPEPPALAEAKTALATAQAALEAERAGREADRKKARDNQTLLAVEVKKLRGQAADQARSSAESTRQLEAAIAGLRDELAAAQARAAALDDALAAAKAHPPPDPAVDGLRDELAAAQARAAALDDALATAKAHPPPDPAVDGLRDELAAAQARAAALDDALAAAKAHPPPDPAVDGLRDELAAAQARAAALDDALAAAKAHPPPDPAVDGLRDELAAAQARAAALDDALAAAKAHPPPDPAVDGLRDELAAAQARAAALEEALAAAKAQPSPGPPEPVLLKVHLAAAPDALTNGVGDDHAPHDEGLSPSLIDAEALPARAPFNAVVEAAARELEAVTQQLAEAQTRIVVLEGEAERITAELATLRAQAVTSAADMTAVCTELDAARAAAAAEAAALSARLADAESAGAAATAAAAQALERLQAAEADAAAGREQLAAASAAVAELSTARSALAASQTALTSKDEEVQALRAQLAEATTALHAAALAKSDAAGTAEPNGMASPVVAPEDQAWQLAAALDDVARLRAEVEQLRQLAAAPQAGGDQAAPAPADDAALVNARAALAASTARAEAAEAALAAAKAELESAAVAASVSPSAAPASRETAFDRVLQPSYVVDLESEVRATREALMEARGQLSDLRVRLQRSPSPAPTTSTPAPPPPPPPTAPAGAAGDDLLSLFDDVPTSGPAGLPGLAAPLPPPAGGLDSDGDLLSGFDPLPPQRVRSPSAEGAAALRQQLQAVQVQLSAAVAENRELRAQVADALNAAVLTQLGDTVSTAAGVLAALRSGDTAEALRVFERAMDAAAATKPAAGRSAQAVTAAAEAAMDTFLARLGDSNSKLEAVAAQVQQLSKAAQATRAGGDLLLDPSPSPQVQQLHARLADLLADLLGALRAAHVALNEMRCEKALAAGAGLAETLSQRGTAPAPAAPAKPQPQRPAGQSGALLGSSGDSGSALSAVSSLFGAGASGLGGLFSGGGGQSGAAHPAPPQQARGQPQAQAGVFSRLLPGTSTLGPAGAQQQPPQGRPGPPQQPPVRPVPQNPARGGAGQAQGQAPAPDANYFPPNFVPGSE